MRKYRLIFKYIYLISLIAYLWYTLDTTIFSRNEYADYQYKAVPFWSYKAIMDGKDLLIKEDLLNVALFIPIGFLLLYVLPRRSWWKALLFGLGFSCFIELIQLVWKRGTCEFDDVFHNTIGCILGYCVSLILTNLYNSNTLEQQ